MRKVKIKLLNDGGYNFLEGVNFPVEVEACEIMSGYGVSTSELERVGAASHASISSSWCFTSEECEEISK